MKWERCRLGNLFHVKHGFAFKSQYFDTDGPYVVMTPGHFREEGGFRHQNGKTKYYTGDVPSGFILDKGSLVVAMTEQMSGLLGSSVLVPEDNRYLHNQRLGRIVDIDEHRLDKRYLYHLFNTHEVRAQIAASASGVKVRHTSPDRIGDVKVSLPPLSVQQKVAYILSAYDDLMENNARRIRLLEESARLLYEEWFVRLRFPGHEHTPIHNGTPKGWERKPLVELAEMVMGQSPPSSLYNEDGDGLPFHQGVSDFGDRFVTHRIYTTATRRIAEAGDILCSVRAPVGRLNIAPDKLVVGRGLAALRSRTEHQSLLYYQLKNHFFQEDLIGGGAIFASVSKKDLERQDLLMPPDRLARNFEDFSCPIDDQIKLLWQKNQKLQAARDLLLPRLMSGEVAA